MTKSKRRKNCFDTVRARIMLAKRARQTNPAFSAAHQLLAIFGLLALSMPKPIIESTPKPLALSKDLLSKKLGVAKRYVDVYLSRGAVPYSHLLDHLRGAATRGDALSELRKRMPAETLDWLTEIEEHETWSSLTMCFSKDGDEQTELKMLKAAAEWEESKPSGDKQPKPTSGSGGKVGGDGKGGIGGVGSPPSPSPDVDPDHDPNKPKN
jgi:hypothetical protein